jgi:hypothetical protein
MLLKDAMADKNIKAVRLPEWADPKSHLLLPPWIESHNCRGVWYKLHDCGQVIDIPIIELNENTDNNPNWEIFDESNYNNN